MAVIQQIVNELQNLFDVSASKKIVLSKHRLAVPLLAVSLSK